MKKYHIVFREPDAELAYLTKGINIDADDALIALKEFLTSEDTMGMIFIHMIDLDEMAGLKHFGTKSF